MKWIILKVLIALNLASYPILDHSGIKAGRGENGCGQYGICEKSDVALYVH